MNEAEGVGSYEEYCQYQNAKLNTEKSEITESTAGTSSNDEVYNCTLNNPPKITQGTLPSVKESDFDLPCYSVQDDWFLLNHVKRNPGVYWCEDKKNADDESTLTLAWICSPLHIDGVSNTEDGKYFGRLLRFKDTLGRWRKWSMPMELLRGSCEELRGELLAAGVLIDHKMRGHLPKYLQHQTPTKVITAATRTGWSQNEKSFVFHDAIIGDQNIFFQSESLNQDGVAKSGGDYSQWQNLAKLCESNPVLMVSLCVSFAGALIAKTHQDSGGVHWLGDSSIGKSTALMVGCSVWGDEKFKRTWRATSNGLEGVAALLSDSCLCLDEINEADPREVGAIVYSLGNGTGKTRANRTGASKAPFRWRLSLISTGERSVSAMMQEGGKNAKSGQLVRLLNIPATRKHGVFDELHHFSDGREMADYFKTQCSKHYGNAGVKFVEFVIKKGEYDYCKRIAELEQHFSDKDSQAARVSSRFALYALAGELAIEAGILLWKTGAALEACNEMFKGWLSFRGDNSTEHTQILKSVSDYILKFGDSKFTDKDNANDKPKGDRSGWWTDRNGERIYLFSSEGLREAGNGFDFKRVLDSLDKAGWIFERSEDKRSKQTRISGGEKKHNLYWILPTDDNYCVPAVPSKEKDKVPLQATNIKPVPFVLPVPSPNRQLNFEKDAEVF